MTDNKLMRLNFIDVARLYARSYKWYVKADCVLALRAAPGVITTKLLG